MTDPIATIETDATKAEGAVASLVAPATTDLKSLLATRAGDLLIAAIALGGVIVGHLI